MFCRTLKLAGLATIPTSWMVTIPLAVFVPSLTEYPMWTGWGDAVLGRV